MAILSAPEPPKQQHSHKRGYGSVTPSFNRRTSRSEPANPASPFKSPLPRKSDLPSDPETGRASGSSPPPSHAPSSSQLSSPPSLGEQELPESSRRDREVEEDMEVEEVQLDEDEEDEEEEDIGRSVKDVESDDESMTDDRPIVHIEARVKPTAGFQARTLEANIRDFLGELDYLNSGEAVEGWDDITCLHRSLESLIVAEISNDAVTVRVSDVDLEIHVYTMSWEDDEAIAGDLSDDEDEANPSPSAASSKSLPSEELDGLWQNLIYPDNLKERLLQYIYSAIFFSDRAIDSGIVNWNRLVLLHGPPGTGKTSLCRALAQKISIRLQKTYSTTKIVEINSHSLFSKWFSESGKLVQKLFSHVTDMTDNEECFVVVMIDEVESLTGARSAGGSEPGDALRVVNALLTQLDKLKTRKNVLVLTTSNLSHAIDTAFIDRADIKEYVPLPPPEAIFWMLRTCFLELMDKKAMKTLAVHNWVVAKKAYQKYQNKANLANGHTTEPHPTSAGKLSKAEREANLVLGLAKLAHRCHEYKMSGRILRRMPMMAHTRYIGRQRFPSSATESSISRPERWLEAMEKFVEAEQADREKIAWDKGDMQ